MQDTEYNVAKYTKVSFFETWSRSNLNMTTVQRKGGIIQKQKKKKGHDKKNVSPLHDPNTPLLPHPLLSPLTIWRTIRFISGANTRPDPILRAMICRTRRRRRQLHSLELRIGDNPHPIQIPHELEIRPTTRQRLPGTVMEVSDVIEHSIPG